MQSVRSFEQFTMQPDSNAKYSRTAASNALALGDQYQSKPSELTSSDIQTIMKLHNDVRARYGVAPLQWDNTLAESAKKWADTCYWGHQSATACSQSGSDGKCLPGKTTKELLGSDYFPPYKQLGENLSIWTDPGSTKLAGQYGTDLWLNEERDFDCASGKCIGNRVCGHFTQQIWSGSQRIGCALRTCEQGVDKRSWRSNVDGMKGVKYFVCKYDPPGNFGGQRPIPVAQCSQPGLQSSAAQKRAPVVVNQGNITRKDPEKTIDQTPTRNTQYDIFRQPIVPATTGTGNTTPAAPAGTGDLFAGLRPGSGVTVTTTPAPVEPPTTLTPRPGFVPEGITLVRLETPTTKNTVNQTKNGGNSSNKVNNSANKVNNSGNKVNNSGNNSGNSGNKSTSEPLTPAPEPNLNLSGIPSPSPQVATTAGLSLLGASVLGAAAGALWFFSEKNRSDKKNNDFY